MKAHWTEEDYNEMLWKPLPFAPEDVELIYLGLAARETRGSSSLRRDRG